MNWWFLIVWLWEFRVCIIYYTWNAHELNWTFEIYIHIWPILFILLFHHHRIRFHLVRTANFEDFNQTGTESGKLLPSWSQLWWRYLLSLHLQQLHSKLVVVFASWLQGLKNPKQNWFKNFTTWCLFSCKYHTALCWLPEYIQELIPGGKPGCWASFAVWFVAQAC